MPESDEDTDTRPDSNEFNSLNLSHVPDFSELLKCVLGVNKSETRTYLALLQNQDADIQTLTDVLDRADSTVREQVAALREMGLVTRDTRVPESGLHHTYRAVPLEKVKSLLKEAVDLWVVEVMHRIENLADPSIDESTMHRSAASTSSSSTITENPSAAASQLLDEELPSLRSIAKCVFGIPYPELNLYLVLLNHPRSTAQELAQVQNFARTTVAGRLNALQDRGLARPAPRETEMRNSIAYEYVPRPLDDVKTGMINQLQEEWVEYAHSCIDDFDLSPADYRD